MVITIIISALVLGFMGSFHCVGMCGPIALSLPVQHLKGTDKAIGIGLYNFGRILTYSVAGIFFGLIGMSFQFFGWQQWLSIILGILLILIFVVQINPSIKLKRSASFNKWNQWVISRLTPLFRSQKKRTLIAIGILNGMLPCGLVYMALAGALATGNIIYSAIFMAGFGAGTLPAMVMASYAAGMITVSTRKKIRKVLPFFLAIMGILLILRGMNLDIPVISAHLHQPEAIICK